MGRLEALRNIQRILEMLVSEIRYGRATLPECCLRIAKRLAEPYKSSFQRIYEDMQENTGIMFDQAFGERMEECLNKLPLSREDKKCFLTLFGENGFEDESMQIRSIETSKELLAHTIEDLEKENTQKCRMAVGLGAMSGLLLIIILF